MGKNNRHKTLYVVLEKSGLRLGCPPVKTKGALRLDGEASLTFQGDTVPVLADTKKPGLYQVSNLEGTFRFGLGPKDEYPYRLVICEKKGIPDVRFSVREREKRKLLGVVLSLDKATDATLTVTKENLKLPDEPFFVALTLWSQDDSKPIEKTLEMPPEVTTRDWDLADLEPGLYRIHAQSSGLIEVVGGEEADLEIDDSP
ncbi:hypothetical protein SCOR_23950 [Sulfidibacter corallicola]|uniref:Uncharacterized protein n=1 Tax=Sulfidibacter corallicola TaxID=2818388 RepID=A0A8A4TRD2_SULCO|nr:hypothetical protein [Sulfidibacter corallicola]QTD52536.1 hypothetical protein J3U87_08690 [Sulfidibacter corallicola]